MQVSEYAGKFTSELIRKLVNTQVSMQVHEYASE